MLYWKPLRIRFFRAIFNDFYGGGFWLLHSPDWCLIIWGQHFFCIFFVGNIWGAPKCSPCQEEYCSVTTQILTCKNSRRLGSRVQGFHELKLVGWNLIQISLGDTVSKMTRFNTTLLKLDSAVFHKVPTGLNKNVYHQFQTLHPCQCIYSLKLIADIYHTIRVWCICLHLA